MNPQPKPTVDRSASYKKWIKQKPCLVSTHSSNPTPCAGPVDPAHMVPTGHAAMGSKRSDWRCLPLCRKHHEQSPGPIQLFHHHLIVAEGIIRNFRIEYDRLFPRPKVQRAKKTPTIRIVKKRDRIVGGLRSCIDAHGPITVDLIPSAVKRILGALKT